MSERQEFGPNLRLARMRRGLTVSQIANATKVSADLWEGLERNDLSRWPTGLYARAYVRAFAVEVGLDPEETVDEFCRLFPIGDRRAVGRVREQAALIGHDLRWQDDLAHVETDRRAEPPAPDLAPMVFTKAGRLIAAVGDASAVLAGATLVSAVTHARWPVAATVCALVYHGGSLMALGSTPSVWAIQTYLNSRHPSNRQVGAARFLRLVRGSERAKA